MKTGVVTRILGASFILAAGVLAIDRGMPFFTPPTGLVSEADAQSPPPLDDFQCYQSKTASGTAHFVPLSIATIDVFGEWHFSVAKPTDLCNPANVAGSDPSAPSHTEHLESYQIKRFAGTAKFPKTLNQTLVDRFGTLTIDLLKPERLLVPSAKSLLSYPPPISPDTDHFTCYKARTSTGTAKFTPVMATVVADQFGSLSVNIMKLRRLCVPTNKNNEAPNAELHVESLSCYQVKLQSTFTPIRAYTANQFGSEALDVRKPFELCFAARLNSTEPTPTPTPVMATPTATQTAAVLTPTPTLTASATPTFTMANPATPTATKTATPTKTTTPTPSRTTTPGPTATPISKTCTIGGGASESVISLQVKNAPLVGNIRVQGPLTGSQTLTFGGQDANGVRPVTVPFNSIVFDPVIIDIPDLGGEDVYICVTHAGVDGTGKVDCNGGDANYDYQARADHDTTGAPGTTGGLPQDPECDDTRTDPSGAVDNACLETSVSTCNTNHPHLGRCNSPTEFIETTAFPTGGMRIAETLTLRIVSDFGPDMVQCTDDDTYSPPATLTAYLTTGTARATIYDTNGNANSLMDHLAVGSPATSYCSNCVTQVTGATRTCNQLTGGSGTANLKLVGALPVIDIDPAVGDAGVTIEVTCQ